GCPRIVEPGMQLGVTEGRHRLPWLGSVHRDAGHHGGRLAFGLSALPDSAVHEGSPELPKGSLNGHGPGASRVSEQGQLVLGGCGVPELAEIYGTPLHVVDAARLRDSYRRFLAAFRAHYPRVELFFSYKTNCIPGVLKLLHEAGCGA